MARTEEMIMEAVERLCGVKGLTAEYVEVPKNNGMVKKAVTIKKAGSGIAPTIYIDKDIEEIKDGKETVEDVAIRIMECYNRNQPDERMTALVDNLDKATILEKVQFSVINMERNAEMLSDIPSRKFLDMAAIYRVHIQDTDNGVATFIVKDQMLERFGIITEELEEAAEVNTRIRSEFRIKSIAETMAEMGMIPYELAAEMGEENPMYVATNRSKLGGASILLYTEYFKNLAEQLDDDLYILPSSIHEVLVVPASIGEPEMLKDMVQCVNTEEVAPEEVLSSNVYKYSREDGVLSVA